MRCSGPFACGSRPRGEIVGYGWLEKYQPIAGIALLDLRPIASESIANGRSRRGDPQAEPARRTMAAEPQGPWPIHHRHRVFALRHFDRRARARRWARKRGGPFAGRRSSFRPTGEERIGDDQQGKRRCRLLPSASDSWPVVEDAQRPPERPPVQAAADRRNRAGRSRAARRERARRTSRETLRSADETTAKALRRVDARRRGIGHAIDPRSAHRSPSPARDRETHRPAVARRSGSVHPGRAAAARFASSGEAFQHVEQTPSSTAASRSGCRKRRLNPTPVGQRYVQSRAWPTARLRGRADCRPIPEVRQPRTQSSALRLLVLKDARIGSLPNQHLGRRADQLPPVGEEHRRARAPPRDRRSSRPARPRRAIGVTPGPQPIGSLPMGPRRSRPAASTLARRRAR